MSKTATTQSNGPLIGASESDGLTRPAIEMLELDRSERRLARSGVVETPQMKERS
jgi:hypothetical protein